MLSLDSAPPGLPTGEVWRQNGQSEAPISIVGIWIKSDKPNGNFSNWEMKFAFSKNEVHIFQKRNIIFEKGGARFSKMQNHF